MTEKRDILKRVADGDLTPEEAADLLEGRASGPDAQEPGETLFPGASIRRIKLKGAFRNATILADPTVTTASVEGDHTARMEGRTLIIDGDDELAGDGFRIERGRRTGRTIRIGVDNPRPVPLLVRINPDIDVEAEIAAGALKVLGTKGRVHAEVSAGALSIEDASGPLDLTTAAGPVKVKARIREGEHRIRCEAGAVKVVLLEGSDVNVRAKASLGKVSLPGVKNPAGFSIGSQSSEATIGAGNATLSIDCSVGGIKVVLEQDEEDR